MSKKASGPLKEDKKTRNTLRLSTEVDAKTVELLDKWQREYRSHASSERKRITQGEIINLVFAAAEAMGDDLFSSGMEYAGIRREIVTRAKRIKEIEAARAESRQG